MGGRGQFLPEFQVNLIVFEFDKTGFPLIAAFSDVHGCTNGADAGHMEQSTCYGRPGIHSSCWVWHNNSFALPVGRAGDYTGNGSVV